MHIKCPEQKPILNKHLEVDILLYKGPGTDNYLILTCIYVCNTEIKAVLFFFKLSFDYQNVKKNAGFSLQLFQIFSLFFNYLLAKII